MLRKHFLYLLLSKILYAVYHSHENGNKTIVLSYLSVFLILSQEGRTPLHYAAALQGTTGGHNNLYTLLVEAGASEDVVDVVGQRFLNMISFKISMRGFPFCVRNLWLGTVIYVHLE